MGRSHRATILLMAGACLMDGVAANAKSPNPPKSGFWLPGLVPGAKWGFVSCLSGNGVLAGGTSADVSPSIFAAGFTWTQAGGRYDFGLLAGMPPYTTVYGISDAGKVAGTLATTQITHAYRWTGTGPLQDLGVLPDFTRSYASGISGDGNVVVGRVEIGNMDPTTQAFRWTPAKGMEGLGYLKPLSTDSTSSAVSRDGLTIVGVSTFQAFDEAFVWREGQGMTALPSLVPPAGGTAAKSVNADGTVIVGLAPDPLGIYHAVRWVNGEIEDLTVGSIYGYSHAYAVSGDGNVIGGFSGPAFLWTPSTGMLAAEDYLALHGVSVPSNYLIEDINAISGDGLTIAGQAKNLKTGFREGFVSTVPANSCKADCDASGELDIDDFICFQTRFAISDPYADCDGNTELTIDDFVCFQTLYAVGC